MVAGGARPGGLLVELAAGSAALSMSLLRPRRAPLTTYMGGKGRYAARITQEMGIVEPSRFLLVDPGPWGGVWSVLTRPGGQEDVLQALRWAVTVDPRALYDLLRAQEAPLPGFPWTPWDAAAFLALQRLSFRAKPVGFVSGKWVVHGLNVTDAYGRPASGTFGAIAPMLPCLVRRLEALPPLPGVVFAVHGRAEDVDPADWAPSNGPRAPSNGPRAPFWAYLDPPYVGTTGYSDYFSRSAVVAVAERWYGAGAVVGISETEPVLPAPWRSVDIGASRKGRKSTMQTDEYLTLSPKPAPPTQEHP